MECDGCTHIATVEIEIRRLTPPSADDPPAQAPLKLCSCCARTVRDAISYAAISLALNGTIEALTRGCPDRG